MHIHGSIPGIQAAGYDGVSKGQRAEAARRAAETRRRLLQAGAATETGPAPEEAALVGQWMDARHSQVLSGPAGSAAQAGRDPDLG